MLGMKMVINLRETLVQNCNWCGADIGSGRKEDAGQQLAMFGLAGTLCKCGQSYHPVAVRVNESTTCGLCRTRPSHWKPVLPSNIGDGR